MQASDLASDYNQIINVIIPSIENAIWNKDITSEDDKKDPVEDTDWTHYGLDELYAKMQSYEGQRSVLIKSGYNVPWTEESDHAQDYHEARYQEYLDLCNQLDASYSGSCAEAYEQRKQEVTDAETLRDQYNSQRQEIASSVQKETWKHYSSINESEYKSFSDKDLELLNKLYYDTDYVNDNMFLVSSDTQVTAIDEQKKLYDAAINDLSSTSQPQFKYSTTLDNFLAITQYSDFSKELNIGNYIRLDVRDNYQVKLRIISISFNPMVFDNDLDIEFSNMVKSKSKRTDMEDLLSSSSSISKNQISGSSNGSSSNIDDTTMRAILNKLLNSSALSNKINSSVTVNGGGSGSGSSMTLSELETKLKKLIDLDTGDGFFNYLQAELISTGKIVADSGEFKDLSAFVAAIDNLLAGTISGEQFHTIRLTTENAVISEALIKSLIAEYITVNDLKASNIITDKIKILSQDGKLQIIGNTFTIFDNESNPVIQLGQDKKGNYGLVISDSNGTILLDSEGLHEGIVPNDFIKTDMIADGAVTETKIDKTNICEWTDDNGNKVFDVANLYYGNDKFSVSYNSMKTTVENLSGMVDTIELYGEQAFKEEDGLITPEFITINALEKNNALVSKWYIDGIENKEFVSEDKKSLTIPSSFMINRKSALIKAENSSGELFDLFTIYKLTKGSDAITSIISSSNGNIFKDTSYVDTTLICNIYKGDTIIEPNWYKWFEIIDDNNTWEEIGTGKQITIQLDSFNKRARIKCQYDI